jgi:hypothetical protein
MFTITKDVAEVKSTIADMFKSWETETLDNNQSNFSKYRKMLIEKLVFYTDIDSTRVHRLYSCDDGREAYNYLLSVFRNGGLIDGGVKEVWTPEEVEYLEGCGDNDCKIVEGLSVAPLTQKIISEQRSLRGE